MDLKIVLLVACLLCTLAAVEVECQEPVEIPTECAQSCPSTGGNKLCAKNSMTKSLGTFDSDCIFGRYNSCFKTTQQYEFVKYGDC